MKKDSYIQAEIAENQEIYPNIYVLKLKGDFEGRPGQFYMLRGWSSLDPFLARPISISDLDEEGITFLYEAKGRGTQLISSLEPGDSLGLLGPLGNGFELEEGKRTALLAGGIGIAPMLYLAKNIKDVDLYVGFRDESYYLDRFEGHVGEIHLATETGQEGRKGYVTELLNPEDYDRVLACGPTPMMKVLKDVCQDRTQLELSLEARMACGIGACTGCTVETRDGMKRVCKEGPVFPAEEVIFHD